jgi:hypothetical protein
VAETRRYIVVEQGQGIERNRLTYRGELDGRRQRLKKLYEVKELLGPTITLWAETSREGCQIMCAFCLE